MPLAEDIVMWIRDTVLNAGAKGVVIGLSGGIDSSLVAALAARALPGNVLGAVLPCESAPQDAEDARLVATAFQVETVELDLTAAYRALVAVLPDAPRLVRANIKPRLRMAALYYLAASRHYLVCGASNRSELAIGYFTKFGDGGVDMMPIGGLLKGEVVALAKQLGVPQRIIDRPPTAGLWPGQTDEGEMGLRYADLDAALVALASNQISGISPQVRARVCGLMGNSAHKRALPPVFIPTR
jgi:NAD+ synthase